MADVPAILGDLEAPYALIVTNIRSLGGFIPDCTIREVHNDASVITTHPTLAGEPVSDHVFDEPPVLEMTIGFSDSSAETPGYVQQVYAGLLALKATRQPFSAATGKRLYDNVLFRNLAVTTDEASEFALMVVATLQQLLISDTSATGGLSAANQASPQDTAPETNIGQVQLQPVTPTPSGANIAPGSGPLSFNDYLTGFSS